jgi:hypothetical protein
MSSPRTGTPVRAINLLQESPMSKFLSGRRALAAISLGIAAFGAQAAPVNVKVTVESLVPANGISFAPVHVGFGNGSFDAFNVGGVASAAIISVAEGGSASAWFPAFAAADPGSTRGTVLGAPLQPGGMFMNSFVVDSALNRYFTFASMVVPSNDHFVGNDDPMEYELFGAGGALQITSITVKASEIWDAGSEAFDPAHAAFVVGGNNDLRTPQGSVVAFNFGELAAFNGMTTATGYVLSSQLRADTDVLRFNFEVTPVPEPETYALLLGGLAALGFMARRRRAAAETA